MVEVKSFQLSPEIHSYLIHHSTPLDPVQQELIEETRKLGSVSIMQIAPEQGALMELLVRVSGATHALEVGTFTGYSALCIARGLRDGGRLLCLDNNAEWTAIAERHWARAGVRDRIDLRLGPALESLDALPEKPQFDFAFLDADKENYAAYFDTIVPRLHPGGLLVCDNVLWMGRVADPAVDDEGTRNMREFNRHVASDDRVEQVMLPIADGLTVARKRST